MAAINLSSAFNQGLEGGESALSVAMQNYQVQVSEATTKKSEDLVPVEGVGQEFLRAGLGNLGGKIANATGLKSLSKIGQESITTTLRNAAEEAAGKGKAFAAKGVKTRLNDALEARGFSRFSDEELDAIGDKPSDVVKAFAAKAKGTGEQALSAVRDQADAVGGGTQRAVQSAAAEAGGVARTAEGEEGSATLLPVSEDAARAGYKAKVMADDGYSGASKADKQSIRDIMRSDPIAGKNPLDPDLSSTDRVNVLKRRGEIIDDFKQRATGLDKAPSLPDGGTLGLSAEGSEPARVETKANEPVAPAGEQRPPVPAVPAEPAVAPTEAPAGEAPPPAAAPPPASDPSKPPVSINAADEPPVPNGGAFRQEVESTVRSGMSDVDDGLSTATKTLGAADLAAGGLDVLGDVAEAGLGIASLFLPSLLGGGGSSVAPPTAGFQASYQAGVSSTDA